MERRGSIQCLSSPEPLRQSSSQESEPRGSSPNIPDFDEDLWQGLEEVGQELDRFAQEVLLVTQPGEEHHDEEEWSIRNQENKSSHDITLFGDVPHNMVPESAYENTPPSQSSSRLRVRDINQIKAFENIRVPSPPSLSSFNTTHQVTSQIRKPSLTNTVEKISEEEKICEMKALQSLREKLVSKVKMLVLHKKNLYAQRCKIVTTFPRNSTREEKTLQKNSQLAKEIERKLFSFDTHIHSINKKIAVIKKDLDLVHGSEDDLYFFIKEDNKSTNTSRTHSMNTDRNFQNKKRSLGDTKKSKKRRKMNEVTGEKSEVNEHIAHSTRINKDASKTSKSYQENNGSSQSTSSQYAGNKAQEKISGNLQTISRENGVQLHATSSKVYVGSAGDVHTQRDNKQSGLPGDLSNDRSTQIRKETTKSLTPPPPPAATSSNNTQGPHKKNQVCPKAGQEKKRSLNQDQSSLEKVIGKATSQALPTSIVQKGSPPVKRQMKQTNALKEENGPLKQSEAASTEKDGGGGYMTTKKPATVNHATCVPAERIIQNPPTKVEPVDPNSVVNDKEQPPTRDKAIDPNTVVKDKEKTSTKDRTIDPKNVKRGKEKPAIKDNLIDPKNVVNGKEKPVTKDNPTDPKNVVKGKEKPANNVEATTTSLEKGVGSGGKTGKKSTGGGSVSGGGGGVVVGGETGKKSTTAECGGGVGGNLNKDLSTHWCQPCNIFFKTTLCYVKHLHSPDHVDKIQDTTVKKVARNLPGPGVEAKPDVDTGKQPCPAVGVEFMHCGRVFVCELCAVIIWDAEEAAAHPTTPQHLSKYKEYVQKNTNKEMEFIHAKMEAFTKYCSGRISCQRRSSAQRLLNDPQQ
ncbi:hypothetical protein Pcinc_021707 [Petrolisthes cinctipes]|uniref:Uncharacterized protein n=1 Tax=Petrolisthes cinctipes TaxID=88211 RepID=A0AAE1FGV8_PETCI|nr:hypothetical protein Pcinc_021707 [Petrolisthes cinctipes]